jgi:hypothetical protein
VPFLRWFCDRYQVDPSRMVVVFAAAAWRAGIATSPPLRRAARSVRRRRIRVRGTPPGTVPVNRKQHRLAEFDSEIPAAGAEPDRPRRGGRLSSLRDVPALHQFWLGNESLQYVQETHRYTRVDLGPAPALPSLPERFIAGEVLYGKAIPKTEAHWHQLRALVEHLAAQSPIVALDTGLVLDDTRTSCSRGSRA